MNLKKILCVILFIFTVLISGCELTVPDLYKDYEKANTYIEDSSNSVTVFCLDVGQADCILIKSHDKSILIDAGNINDGDNVIEFLKRLDIDKIDYLIGTHPHEDHIGGMPEVIENFEIGEIYLPKISDNDIPTTNIYEKLLDAVANEGCPVFAAKGGKKIVADDKISLDILAPSGTDYGDLNNYSIVTKLTCFNTKMLLMGDAEKKIEYEIYHKKYDVNADIIKLGHHGSDSSTGKKFLKSVNAADAIISCGKNNFYGHPHQDTLKNLVNAKLNIYRTDIDGTVIVNINRSGYKILTDKDLNLDGGVKNG